MSLVSGRARVRVILLDGSDARELISGLEDQGIPTWSADGRFVTFGELKQRRDPKSMRIRTYDMHQGASADLPGSEGMWSPRWSPDGKFISAVSTESQRIRLYDVQGKRWRDLAKLQHYENQAWTFDGRYLLGNGSTGRDGSKVVRVRLSDGNPEQLADFGDGYADWIGSAPDGTVLAGHEVRINDVHPA